MRSNCTLRILNKDTYITIPKLHLNRRYKRGGRRLKHDYRMYRKLQNTPKLNITSNLIFILVKGIEQSSINSTQVRLTITNIQSIKNKDRLLYDHINTFIADITVIMETRQKNNENDIAWSNTFPINIDNLRLYTSYRIYRSGGDTQKFNDVLY